MEDCLRDTLESSLAMDTADAGEPPRSLQSLTEHPCVGQTVLHDLAVSVEAQMDQVVVLPDHLGAGPREVKRVRFLGAAEVMKLEDQVLGQVRAVAPDDPSDAGVDQAVLVSRGVDGFHARQLEVPAEH